MIAILSVTQGEGHGAETVLLELLRGISDKNAYRIIAVKGSKIAREAALLEYDVRELDVSRDSILHHGRALPALKKQALGCRLIHAWTARGFDPAFLCARSLNIQFSGTLHDHPKAMFHGKFRQRLMRICANRMNALVCVSNATATEARRAQYKDPINVITNGLKDFAPSHPLNQRSPSQSASPKIAFLGMYTAWKGFSIIREWIEELTSPAEWNLYGDVGADVQPLTVGLPDHVRVCGRQSIDRILSDNDLLVHASTHFDPYPTVLLEAACYGRGVIACDLGGASEIVEESVTGFLFKPSEKSKGFGALAHLCESANLREELGRKARERYEKHFQLAQMVEKYECFWASIG